MSLDIDTPVRAGTDASFDWDSHTASNEDGTYDTDSRTDATGQNAAGISSISLQTGTNANLPPYYALCYIIKHTATASSGGGIRELPFRMKVVHYLQRQLH